MRVRPLVKAAYRRLLVARAAGELRRLRDSEDEALRLVGEAIHDAVGRRPTPDEAATFAGIEAVRRAAEASSDPIGYVDFGSGSPTLGLSIEAMEAGRRVQGTVGALARSGSKSHPWTTLLYHLARRAAPATALELGTAFGFTGAYLAAGAARGGGRVVTLEGAPEVAARAREHYDRLAADNIEVVVGRFSDTLPGVLARHAPIGLLFVDGRLDGPSYLGHLRQAAPAMARPAIAVFSSITWSRSLRGAWPAIQQEASVRIAVDLGRFGVCVVDDAGPRHQVRLPLL